MNTKIAFFIINHSWVGGVERVTSNLLKIFISNKINMSSLISLAKNNTNNKIINFPANLVIKCIDKEFLTDNLTTYLKKEKITHLIFQGDNMSYALQILKATKSTSCKAYLHYHGSPYAYLNKYLYGDDIKEKPFNIFKIIFSEIVYPFKKRKLLRVINSCNDGFVTVSNAVKKELNTLYKTNFNNITAIHNPISFQISNEINLNKKEKKIIFISRLERKDKNAFLVLKAWEIIHNQYPKWEFQILGNGRLMPKMKAYITNKNIKNFHLLGHVNNVNDYLEKSSISVLSSDCEGFGMGLFESMAYKNAIVSTKSHGGVVDLVVHGYNGFLVPKNDHKKMAKRIAQLITDKELRNKMGNNSLIKYQKISNENVLEQWTNLLKLNHTNS